MKDLLVYVSSPARSQLFMSYAAFLARDLGLSVRYLHVHSPGSGTVGMPGSVGTASVVSLQDIESRLEKAKYHFELQIGKINASDPGLPLLEYKIETGEMSEIIKEYCTDKKVDTVMISSTKERSWLSGDSYQIDLIRKLSCPVWVIPEGIAYKSFSEILYATDYNQEDIPNLKLLARFAARFPASITVVHVSEDIDFEEKVKGAGFARMIRDETGYDMIDHKVLQEKKGEPLVRELNDFALMVDADLVVLLRENRGLIDRLLHGSRSEKIARETQLPVLIFNEARR
jgi:nucleotide-binding universal stress UspA family protein